MYLLGHLGFTALSGFVIEKIAKQQNTRFELNYVYLLIGSMSPDLIDKPIGSLLFSTGRWIGHSLLFILLISVFLGIALKKLLSHEKALTITLVFMWGNIMHLILDLTGLDIQVILWPFLGLDFQTGAWNGFLLGIFVPYVWITEIIGLLILISLAKYLKFTNYQWNLGFVAISSYIIIYITLFFFFLVLI